MKTLNRPRLNPPLLAGAGLALALGLALPAAAQNAAAGKLLYNTRYGAQSAGCYSCHGIQGSTLSNISKIRNGVNNPASIQSAIDRDTGGMLFLKPYLTPANVIDIAAYLANPGLVGLGAAVASLSASSLAFASTAVGSRSAAQTLTLSNTGSAALSLASLASNSAQFVVSGGSCAAGTPVAAGASCTVTLAFSPTAAGASSGTFTVTHGVGSSAVALSGSGVASSPAATLSATSLSFSQVVGSPAAAQTVTLSNTGTAALLLSSLGLSGAAAADYSLANTGTCTAGASVAAGSSCSLVLGFTPSAVGSRAATLAIAHNASASPSSISLAGSGTAQAVAALSLDATGIDFGAQALASTSAARSVLLSNSGGAALQLSGLTLGGAQAGDFALAGTCTPTSAIAPGGSCSLQVRFTPGALGSRAGTLTLASNASGGSRVLTLAGSGAAAPAPGLVLSPTAVDFGALTVGGAAGSRSVTLSNTGSASLSLASVLVSGSGFSGSHGCGSTLAAGAACTLNLAFAPAGAGSVSGLASITSNAAGSPHAVALSGSGVLATLPVLAWQTAAPLPFGSVAVGSRSAAQTLTLLNQGPGAATLASLSTQGAAANDFVLGGTCASGTTLAASASCTVSVLFAPAQAGARSATLNLLSNGSNPAALALSGSGAASLQPALSLSATSLALPALAATATGTAMPVTVTNSGNAPLTLTALLLSNTQFTAQSACGSLPVALAAGQACRIDVAANPAGAGDAGVLAATLTLATDISGLAPQVALSGAINSRNSGGDNDNDDDEGNASAGGCSAARPGAAFDPVLWLLALGAAGVLWLRRRQ